jgi:hypothetical protein
MFPATVAKVWKPSLGAALEKTFSLHLGPKAHLKSEEGAMFVLKALAESAKKKPKKPCQPICIYDSRATPRTLQLDS